MTQRAAEAELRAAAALAGVSAEKLPYVVRLCDAAALTAKDADMGKLAQAQVAAVLRGPCPSWGPGPQRAAWATISASGKERLPKTTHARPSPSTCKKKEETSCRTVSNTQRFFQQELDKAFVPASATGWMQQNARLAKYSGGNEIKIPNLVMDGLADYDP